MKLLKSKKGFTMIEMLIAVTIMGILASMMVVQYGDYVKRSEEAVIKHELNQIIHVIDTAIASGNAYIGEGFDVPVTSYHDLSKAEDFRQIYELETEGILPGELEIHEGTILAYTHNERTAYYDFIARTFRDDFTQGKD
ncbi:MAG: prepilin-type N-terminal cleavage/methylation domain-containing protein [Bacilli bacterium]